MDLNDVEQRRQTADRRPPSQSSRPTREAELRRRRVLGILGILAVAGVLALVSGGGAGTGPHRAAARGIRYLANPRQPLRGAEAAKLVAEDRAIDRMLAVTPIVRTAGGQHREIALTFDDGPGPYTPAILSVLERAHVPATFFEVGALERYFNQSTAAIVAHGYPIGDHTEDHAPMSHLDRRDQAGELLEQTAAVGDFGAPFPRLYRPPYGLWNATTLRLLHRYGMLMVLWTVDTDDYLRPGVPVIVGRALHGARPGAIILLHDAGGDRSETVAALPRIIRGLRRRGYTLVTVPRLLLDNPAPTHQNVASLAGAAG